jgi:hypothetical protein
MKRAWVLGATGATGAALVEQLLGSDEYSEVHVFVRRPLQLQHAKLRVHVVDMERAEDWQMGPAADVAFSCLGTTLRAAGSKAAQHRVDVDYQLQFAEMARRSGVGTFVLLSAAGADAKSRFFYMRLKGEAEEGVRALGFERTLFFRPGILDRVAKTRGNERISIVLIRALNRIGLLKRQAPIAVETLARQMIRGEARLRDAGEYVLAERAILDL